VLGNRWRGRSRKKMNMKKARNDLLLNVDKQKIIL
jgi:hypothetical protein